MLSGAYDTESLGGLANLPSINPANFASKSVKGVTAKTTGEAEKYASTQPTDGAQKRDGCMEKIRRPGTGQQEESSSLSLVRRECQLISNEKDAILLRQLRSLGGLEEDAVNTK